MNKILRLLFLGFIIFSCQNNIEKNIPTIGFLDAFQDETLEQAKIGFFDALKEDGFDEENKTLKVYYRNAQGDILTLLQSCDYLMSKNVSLIAANSTLSMITAIQKSKNTPICMMVAPDPVLAGLTNKSNPFPSNLMGVYENVEYIKTSFTLIKTLIPKSNRIGIIYSPSEVQSNLAICEIQKIAKKLNLELIISPVFQMNDVMLISKSLISKNIDVFFALPDNAIFSTFESITKLCETENIPIFTSESGLVGRGALAAYGADIYLWGFQAGKEASKYLNSQKSKLKLKPPVPILLKHRSLVINKKLAKKFKVIYDKSFKEI